MSEPGCDVLVIGASGQDGPYVMSAARRAGLTPLGTSRHGANGLIQLDPHDHSAVTRLLDRLRPERLFVLAGQSSVGRSYDCPAETVRSHTIPLLNCLEWVRLHGPQTRLVYTASGESFGPREAGRPAVETDEFTPVSPYASAKTMAAVLLDNYRRTYRLHASNAFLFNHESARRGTDFVFGKLLAGLRVLAEGSMTDRVQMGDLSVRRDWGYAPDYCEALLRMSDLATPQDLILATGHSVQLADAVEALVAAAGLTMESAVVSGSQQVQAYRPRDEQYADPSLAVRTIGWECSTPFPALAEKLINPPDEYL
ncbi:GDP-mannose 4,6-dehydratase [Novosphingobium tardum]|uniref:GDP-mannose 4,6-dehydratase n=1 Tax=Novosphingobium tardum TaxID=1538021 RepID=A0ABV8RKZ4_9SPHN